ncbi:hypothetical protein Pcinc_001851 [Petrolisthes cinctipes]|uniref:Uncharacterized protein n=1 Tax=Petrolisthes cinctipes TaxID=88211 RepID=A0AAE1GM39_PETCI|nr:hypothetical protein Pcinc_001851 [Petrolisthes cinctipes]
MMFESSSSRLHLASPSVNLGACRDATTQQPTNQPSTLVPHHSTPLHTRLNDPPPSIQPSPSTNQPTNQTTSHYPISYPPSTCQLLWSQPHTHT